MRLLHPMTRTDAGAPRRRLDQRCTERISHKKTRCSIHTNTEAKSKCNARTPAARTLIRLCEAHLQGTSWPHRLQSANAAGRRPNVSRSQKQTENARARGTDPRDAEENGPPPAECKSIEDLDKCDSNFATILPPPE